MPRVLRWQAGLRRAARTNAVIRVSCPRWEGRQAVLGASTMLVLSSADAAVIRRERGVRVVGLPQALFRLTVGRRHDHGAPQTLSG
jgi:hypothetical protein